MRNKIKILITNQKGGVGKSTISANLAGYLAIEKEYKVSLIDFDRQGTSSNLISKNPHQNIQGYKAVLSYQQNSGYTMLEAKAALRQYGAHSDITIADLTWTFGLPYDFILEFDVIIVPSSNSRVEIASTEIFILEYIQKKSARIKQKQQTILVAPSRIDRNQLNEIKFSGLEFLDNCFVCPPIYRVSQINNKLLNDFWFRVDNGIISENMIEFCDFVDQNIEQKIQSRTADMLMPIINTKNAIKLEQVETLAAQTVIKHVKPLAIPKDQSEFSFIPAFLKRK